MAPEVRWLIVASGWRVTVDLLRQAVAENSVLLTKLDAQLEKIGTWDDATDTTLEIFDRNAISFFLREPTRSAVQCSELCYLHWIHDKESIG